jgi:hypothetical protein
MFFYVKKNNTEKSAIPSMFFAPCFVSWTLILLLHKEDTKVSYNKRDVIQVLSQLIPNVKGHDRIAYKFGLIIANNLPEYARFDIRKTKNGAFNLGDLGEIAVKILLEKPEIATWSRQGQTDLNRVKLNEIKVFPASNRNPNGLIEPKPFIAICSLGVYEITKKIVEKYWDEFKDNKGLKEPTLAILKKMIANDSPKLLKRLTSNIID